LDWRIALVKEPFACGEAVVSYIDQIGSILDIFLHAQSASLSILSKTTLQGPALCTFALALRAATTCPFSPTCPQDHQCSLTSNSATLQVSCATDYYGGDLKSKQVSMTCSAVSCLELNTDRFSDLYAGRLHSGMLRDHRMQCCKPCKWQSLPQEHNQRGSA
jgi:hypothetical protein